MLFNFLEFAVFFPLVTLLYFLVPGPARVMGYELMLNFNRPYFATSVGDFWRRCVNLLIVFLLSGVWHGANWTFVVWGLLHGAFVTAEVLAGRGGSAERKKSRGFAFGRAPLVFNLTALFLTEHLGRERSVWSRLAAQPRWLRWLRWLRWGAYYLFAVAFLALTGPQHQAQPFIYFQF